MIKEYVYVFVFLLLFISCNNRRGNNGKEVELKEILGKTFKLPESVKRILPKSKYIIFIYLEKDECVPCALDKFNMFKYYEDDLSKYKTSIVFIVEDSENSDEIKEYFSLVSVEHTVVFDSYDIKSTNPAILANSLSKVFVVDDEYAVIWIGMPIESEASYGRYKKMMELLAKSKK